MAQVTDKKSALEAARQIKKLFEFVSQAEEVLVQAEAAESELPQLEKAKAARTKEMDEFYANLDKEKIDETAARKKLLATHEQEKVRFKKALTDLENDFSVRKEKFDKELVDLESQLKSLKAQKETASAAVTSAKISAQRELQEFKAKHELEKGALVEETSRLRHILESFQAQVRAFSPSI
jgi:chromosome segregation ATPase